ncbi:DUF2939 domain-containing protein [Bosea sp. CS1GBMeth4]|uniref:DUF2939 domain-containing protein n=1 Tax=Bosea sp. CS1GBMeth4 TaxID=1892849 RepID=UPI0016482E02|nr:DUF2939 domain-containing protein [Bosea sp. CS1GBMeth4]
MNEQHRRRRWSRLALVAILVLGLGYWASPYVALARFAGAARSGNVAEVLERIDARRLRASFARQIVRAHAATEPGFLSLPAEARQGASIAAAAYVEAMLAEQLTPELVAQALSGRPAAAARKIELPTIREWGNAWELFNAAGFTGPAAFAVDLATDEFGQIRLVFRSSVSGWLLASVVLPRQTIRQIIDEVRARLKAG